jgi:ketosteroid isomerase-like protein
MSGHHTIVKAVRALCARSNSIDLSHRRLFQSAHFRVLLNTFDIQELRPTDFLSQGDKVVRGMSREGPKGAGRLVDFRWVHVFTFQSGKIVEFEEPADVSALVQEFRRVQAGT